MFDKIFKFTKFLNQFRFVDRTVFVEEKQENDAEHSYQLAMLAWYLIDVNDLDMNKEEVFKYALAHDLVEIYAGDTLIFASKQDLKNKHLKEEEARKRIKKEFPEFKSLDSSIIKYENRESTEARFVYALDKLIPVLNIFSEGGRLWKEHGITLEQLLENKNSKIGLSPEVKVYWKEMSLILKESKKTLFSKEK